MKKIFIPVCGLLMMLSFAACGREKENKTGGGDEQKTQADRAEDVYAVDDGGKYISVAGAKIRIAYTGDNDNFIKKFPSFLTYSVGSGSGEKFIISTDTVLRDFAFLEGSYDFTDDKISFAFDTVSYSVKALSPEKPFLAVDAYIEKWPTYGISFTDANGRKRYFRIYWSGMDGSLSLEECNAKGGALPQ